MIGVHNLNAVTDALCFLLSFGLPEELAWLPKESSKPWTMGSIMGMVGVEDWIRCSWWPYLKWEKILKISEDFIIQLMVFIVLFQPTMKCLSYTHMGLGWHHKVIGFSRYAKVGLQNLYFPLVNLGLIRMPQKIEISRLLGITATLWLVSCALTFVPSLYNLSPVIILFVLQEVFPLFLFSNSLRSMLYFLPSYFSLPFPFSVLLSCLHVTWGQSWEVCLEGIGGG